jgi:ABC-type antimicrobial peptide transport system permease subunit
MALGATPVEVSCMVLIQTVRMACGGAILGTAGALVGSRLLRSILFGVSPYDPLTYFAAAMILFATGLLAGYLPARRASRIDPVTALRYD